MLVRAALLFVLAYIFYQPGTGAPALQIKSLNLLGKIGFTQEKLDRIKGKLSQLNDLVASNEKRPRPLNFQQKVYSEIKRSQEHKGIVEINMDSELAPYFYQGDLLMSDEELDKIIRDYSNRQKRQALSDLTTLWSNPIPYTFSTSYPIDSITQGYIQTILQWIQNHSCLTFVQDSSAAPHIEYNSESSGCFANSLGKPNNTDPRYVNLGAGCNYFPIIAHETFHALGIGHEHERYDRDSYIYLDTNYLASGYLSQFDKYSSLTTTNYNKRYEYGSVMHYYATKCSCLPCQRGGFPNPANCNQCICPDGFSGAVCDQRDPGTNCGATLTASASWQSLSPTFNNGQNCYWHIEAPLGNVIEIQVLSVNTFCRLGCQYGALELKMDDFIATGYKFCCQEDFQQQPTFQSQTNLAIINGFAYITTLNFTIQYRYVPSTNGTPPVPVIDCGSNPTTITTTSSSQGSTTINPIPSNSTCADQETRPGYCDYYKNLSYCEPTSQWYNWSQTWCAKTCGFCPTTCADQETRSGYCDYYKGLGYCDPSSQWYSWSQTWCAKTCGFCPASCADQETRSGYCDYYKGLGYCDPSSQWYSWAQTWCAHTCSFC